MSQLEKIIAKSKSLMGASYIDSSGMTYCQRFVRHCYEAAGLYGSASSAKEAGDKWIVSKSKSDIPIGAAVYFTNGNSNGHVGLYIGNGKMRHVWSGGKVCETSISVASGYRGWGWHGGVKPSGTVSADSSASDESVESESKSKKVDLCSTSVVSTVNKGSKAEAKSYVNITGLDSEFELHIVNNGIDYVPVVVGAVKWTTEWVDTAGKLTFTVLKDSNIDIKEGNAVIFKMSGKGVFYGYLFEKSKDKSGEISCVAYDQLRYFKNKDTYCYKDRSYSELLKIIANDYLLNCRESMADTKYKIPVRVEDNESLFNILQYARKQTLYNTKILYILFDDFGELNIKSYFDLITDYHLTSNTGENFKYKTSIDSEVYNKIQFYRDDDSTGKREMFIYQNGDKINEWGVLQKTIKLEDGDNVQGYGDKLLEISSEKVRELSVNGCFGDVRLRAGASLFVSLDVGDVIYDKALFFITKAVHSFGKSYTCDLTLIGQNVLLNS